MSRSRRRELADVLRELAWTIHRHAPERAGVGPIPTTEIVLLKQVIDNPGATVSELAHALGLRQSNASAAIRALEADGLVVKESSAADRRITRVRPTALGRSEHRAIAAGWSRPVQVAIDSLTDDEQRALDAAAEALEALHKALHASDA